MKKPLLVTSVLAAALSSSCCLAPVLFSLMDRPAPTALAHLTDFRAELIFTAVATWLAAFALSRRHAWSGTDRRALWLAAVLVLTFVFSSNLIALLL